MKKYGKYEFDENSNKDLDLFELNVFCYLSYIERLSEFEEAHAETNYIEFYKEELRMAQKRILDLKDKLTQEIVIDFLKERKNFYLALQKKPNVELTINVGLLTRDDGLIKKMAKSQVKSTELVKELIESSKQLENSDGEIEQ